MIDIEYLPYAAFGALVYTLVLTDLRIGLALTLFCIALSPEMPETIGIRNVRLEDLLLPALVVSWFARALRERQEIEPSALKSPILLYLFFCMLSALHGIMTTSQDPAYTVFYFGKIAEYFVFYFIFLNNVRTPREMQAFVILSVVAACALGFSGIGEFLAGMPAFGGGKIHGPTGETSNVLGGYFVFHLGLVIGLIFEAPNPRAKMLLIGAGAILFVPFLFTLSRTSYAALFGALLTVGILRRRVVLFGLLGLVMMMPLLVPEFVLARIATIFDIFGDSPPTSWTSRVYAWQLFGRRGMDSPLLGVGLGSLAPGRVDNGYVHMMVEIGLVGLGMFLWMLVRALVEALRVHAAYANQPWFRGFGLGFLCGTVGLMLHAIGSPSFTAIRTMEPLMVTMALVTLLGNRAEIWGQPVDESHPAHAPDFLYVRRGAAPPAGAPAAAPPGP